MRKIQTLSRAFYRSFVVAMLLLYFDSTFYFALPFGLLVGMFSEAENLTKKE